MYKITVKDLPNNVTYVQEGTNLGKVVSRLLERMPVDNLMIDDLLLFLSAAIYRYHYPEKQHPSDTTGGSNFVFEVNVEHEHDDPTS